MRARIVADRERFLARFEHELQLWAGANLPRRGKTIQLLTGALSFRTIKGGPRIRDAAAVLTWAEEHAPEAIVETVTTTRKPSAEAIAALYRETGEIPPGVEVAEEREQLYIKAPTRRGKED
jgi:phage host-nuclease inhibitor protein Gam